MRKKEEKEEKEKKERQERKSRPSNKILVLSQTGLKSSGLQSRGGEEVRQ
jgi:hypothetical protein